MEEDRKRAGWPLGRMGVIILSVLGIAIALWIAQVLFMMFFAVREPESVPAPDDVVSDAPAEERGGTPDGGDLTSVPTQAAPGEERPVTPQPDG